MRKYFPYCGSNEHSIKYCPATWGGQMNRAKLHCSFCGSNKHTAEYCPKTFGGMGKRKNDPDGDFVD